MTAKVSRIPTLDGWRAIGIAAVTVHHLGQGFYLQQAAYLAPNNWDLARYGAFGVDIFFGLSGLLITTLLLEQWRRAGSFDLPGFYVRRAFRILPPYLAYLAVCTLLAFWRSPWEAAGSLFFFRNYVPDYLAGPDTQHLWSLAVEEHFYLLWPGLLCLLGYRRARPAAAILAISIAVWRMVESQLAIPTLPWVTRLYRTDLRLDALLWGAVFAFLLEDPAQREKLRQQLRWPMWAGLLTCWVLSVRYYSHLSSVWVACGVPILILGTVVNPRWLFSRFLDWTPVAWLGRISYSLYLWQRLFIIPGWASTAEYPAHWWRMFPFNLIASVLLATASYWVIEKPLIRLGKRMSKRVAERFAKRPEIQAIPAERETVAG